MSKIQPQSTRQVWQPLNRQSQVVMTIAALAIASFQLYTWAPRLLPSPAQLQPVQPAAQR